MKRSLAALGAGALSVGALVPLAPAASANDHLQDLQAACAGLTEGAPFTDIGGLAPATQDAISCLATYEITQGRTATTYAPSTPVRRYEMAIFLDRVIGYVNALNLAGVELEKDTTDAGFEDIGGLSAEGQAAVNVIANLEISQGKSATRFDPYAPVSRRDMASFINRLQGAIGSLVEGAGYNPAAATKQFDDVPADLPRAADIYALEAAGIVQGTSTNTYSPYADVLRSQMAFFIMRHVNENISAGRLGSLIALRDAAPEDLVIGTAVAGGGHHLEQDYPDPFPNDDEYREILAAEFSSVSPENQMKWEFIHPTQDEYNFGPADAIVDFAEENGQAVRGHTLLWHSQNPAWLEEGTFTTEELRAILENHIKAVVGRYAGRIQQWDVANEIFDGEGNLRTTENIWIRELGEGIILDAFRWAHEADPNALLFFNDYGVESVNAKSNAYYDLIQEMQAAEVPVHGFSVQGHLSTRYGFPTDLRENLQRFDDLGLETAVTEVDVRMDLPEGGVPTAEQLQTQAEYYTQALEACLAVEDCDSFTVWGFTDKYSWVPVFFPTEGAATIMWEDFTPKPAYFALQSSLIQGR